MFLETSKTREIRYKVLIMGVSIFLDFLSVGTKEF